MLVQLIKSLPVPAQRQWAINVMHHVIMRGVKDQSLRFALCYAVSEAPQRTDTEDEYTRWCEACERQANATPHVLWKGVQLVGELAWFDAYTSSVYDLATIAMSYLPESDLFRIAKAVRNDNG